MAANVGERVVDDFGFKFKFGQFCYIFVAVAYSGGYSVTFFLRNSDTPPQAPHLHCSLTFILSARWNIQRVQRYLM
jgi:hypothetical protein